MPNFSKALKGALSAVKGTQDVLPAAEREANLAKFLSESKDPRRMYHATGTEFKQFLPGGQSQAVFVTPEAKFAENFALDNFTRSQGSDKFQTGTRTIPVRVQVKKPFDYEEPSHIEHLKEMARKRFPGNQQVMDEIEAMGLFEHNWPSVEHPDIQRLIKQGGYDSFYASERGTKNLGVYDPRKVKSDIGNKGTYDVTKPDINEARGGAIRMQAGGALRAMKAIAKAAESAGQKAPVVASKELTTLQDFHTSLGDRIRQGAADMQNLVESTPFKYDKGQRVFTEDSARKNKAPYEILHRVMVGNQPMRADHPQLGPGMGKVMKDPDTGKTMRTPYEPGYIVRSQLDDGVYEFQLPESAIKGGVEQARGGPVHMGAGGALKALKALAKGEAKAEGKIGQILGSQTPPMTTPMGTGLPLLPRSAGMYPADVPQVDLPRMKQVDKARAAGKAPKYTERMQDLLDSPTARKKVNELIGKGEELGMREWYGTEPLRQAALDMGVSEDKYREFMAQMASASQRNPVDKQNQMGSYLWHLSQTGQLPEDAFLLTKAMKKGKKPTPEGTPIELPEGYGSLAQSAIVERGRQIAHKGAEEALPPNAKLGTFYRNLLGNLQPVTVDVNAVRGPVIARGDPRWLASKLVEKDEEGNIINTFKPRQMLESGEMSLKEAKARPGFWEAAPEGSEYAGFEDLWQRAAKRHGIAPAEAQALGWYGSADITALKTKPELYVENLERLIKRTAETTGKSQTEVLNDMLTGKGFLRKDGGSVESFSARLKAGIEQHMAVGGAVNMSDTRPDVTDAGGMISAPFYAKGGEIKLNFKGLRGRKVQKFDDGGYAEPLSAPEAKVDPTTRQAIANVAGMGKEQLEKEFKMLKDPKARADILKRMGLQTAGGGVDLLNLLASGADIVQEQIPVLRKPASVLDPTGKTLGYQPKFRLASDKPALGSEHLIEKAKEAGLIGENEAPITEILGSIALGSGAANPAKIRGGLNTMTAASRRPFTPATATMEAVAPDLAKFKPRDWQETTTRRLISGEGAPVSMSTMAGQKTTKRAGQGVYFNDPDEFGVRQLETNPMVAVDIPAVGSLAKNKEFRRDISQAGKELGQESVAAHRFLPMLTNTMADANAVLIKPGKGNLSNEQVIELGRMLGGDMVVAHNPRLGGVVVYPFNETKGMPGELVQATQAAKTVLGEGANLRYGRVHPSKDTTYIPRADYAKEGAGEPSSASVAMRERLKKGEARLFREREKSTQ